MQENSTNAEKIYGDYLNKGSKNFVEMNMKVKTSKQLEILSSNSTIEKEIQQE